MCCNHSILFFSVIPESAKSSTINTLDPIFGLVLAKSLENVIAPLLFLTPSPRYDSTESIANGTSKIRAIISPTLIPPLAIQTT